LTDRSIIVLTTSTFAILKADPKLGPAEALRSAMLAYLNDSANPLNAYPAFWGPFSIIGEGAATDRSQIPHDPPRWTWQSPVAFSTANVSDGHRVEFRAQARGWRFMLPLGWRWAVALSS
jgi:hypothetical protein